MKNVTHPLRIIYSLCQVAALSSLTLVAGSSYAQPLQPLPSSLSTHHDDNKVASNVSGKVSGKAQSKIAQNTAKRPPKIFVRALLARSLQPSIRNMMTVEFCAALANANLKGVICEPDLQSMLEVAAAATGFGREAPILSRLAEQLDGVDYILKLVAKPTKQGYLLTVTAFEKSPLSSGMNLENGVKVGMFTLPGTGNVASATANASTLAPKIYQLFNPGEPPATLAK